MALLDNNPLSIFSSRTKEIGKMEDRITVSFE